MRTHGLPGFPEPQIHVSAGSQQVAIRVTPGISSSPNFKSASNACRSILPGPANLSPAQQRTRTADFLSFAQCMRAHGVENFPDPSPQGEISRTALAAAHVDVGLPSVQHAAFTCVPAAHGIINAADVRSAINRLGG
jgi:hypothetical protein